MNDMTDEEHEEMIFNDLNDRIDDELWEMELEQQTIDQLEYSYKRAYKDDTVEIAGSAEDMCYYIDTDKYHITWYVSPCDVMRVIKNTKVNQDYTIIIETKMHFDMSVFCELENSGALPGDLIIKSANGEKINGLIDIMRVFC